jgi:hypothetical protein
MSHEEAIKQVESDHDTKHANLVQGSFDGGATTGKMMSVAFKTYNKCIDSRMSHEEAIKQVESDHDTKHANLVQGSFTAGKMMREAFKTHAEAISMKMSYSAAIEHVRLVHGDKHANMVFRGATLKSAAESVSNYIAQNSGRPKSNQRQGQRPSSKQARRRGVWTPDEAEQDRGRFAGRRESGWRETGRHRRR